MKNLENIFLIEFIKYISYRISKIYNHEEFIKYIIMKNF
jgi:hypothetical protein